jgi:hypothetical protein
VRSRFVVIVNVSPENPAKMALAEDDEVVQAFPPNGPDDSLGIGILPGGLGCREDLTKTHAVNFPRKSVTINAIPISQQESRLGAIAWKRFKDLLGGPLGGRMVSDVEMKNMPLSVVEDDETEQQSKASGWNHKKITGSCAPKMVLEESSPALRWRLWASARHVLRHCRLSEVIAKESEFRLDAWNSPKRIFASHAPNHLDDCRLDPGSATPLEP